MGFFVAVVVVCSRHIPFNHRCNSIHCVGKRECSLLSLIQHREGAHKEQPIYALPSEYPRLLYARQMYFAITFPYHIIDHDEESERKKALFCYCFFFLSFTRIE